MTRVCIVNGGCCWCYIGGGLIEVLELRLLERMQLAKCRKSQISK